MVAERVAILQRHSAHRFVEFAGARKVQQSEANLVGWIDLDVDSAVAVANLRVLGDAHERERASLCFCDGSQLLLHESLLEQFVD